MRKLMRDWGLLEWGHALIGFAAKLERLRNPLQQPLDLDEILAHSPTVAWAAAVAMEGARAIFPLTPAGKSPERLT